MVSTVESGTVYLAVADMHVSEVMAKCLCSQMATQKAASRIKQLLRKEKHIDFVPMASAC